MRTALAVMRIQPLHKGHTRIINEMIESCDTCILGIGSTNVSDKWNPYLFEDRKQMVQNVYGDRLKIVQLADIGTQEGTNDWVDYVLEKIKKLGMPDPTDYFTGSEADAKWYSNKFSKEHGLVDFPRPMHDYKYKDYDEAYADAEAQNSFYFRTDSLNQVKRCLHIVDRDQNDVPAATDLRTFLELGADDWKQWVPKVNHEIVETKYPDHFKIGAK